MNNNQMNELWLISLDRAKTKDKTYNTGDSLVVTDPTTDPALGSLSRGERTGSRVFCQVWSYVLIDTVSCPYKLPGHHEALSGRTGGGLRIWNPTRGFSLRRPILAWLVLHSALGQFLQLHRYGISITYHGTNCFAPH
ncbi:hypothetical protein N658DRAFT_198302 [Parathielavia hyrcaniae]|uniref:Uncharacterized protein n=1 Tax=Parathielavia hyrcaniae TaxID=113614 RepID=A0AAN6QCK7_9PEZI|nr:hypothetical protein N658DRAFT_198302 [Parathielavia hyrcaniae]